MLLNRLNGDSQTKQAVALEQDEQCAEHASQVPLFEKVPEGQLLVQVELERLNAGLHDWH